MELELFNLLTEMEFSDRARGLSDKTIKKNTKFLTMFFKFLSQEFKVNTLKQVTTNMIKSFMIYKKGQENSESYVNVFLRSIRAFFLFCEDEEYITQMGNPTLRVKWMKQEKKILTTFSEEDVKKMLIYTDKITHHKLKKYDKYHTGHLTRVTRERDKFLIMLLVDSGLRISEVHELRDSTLTQEGINVIRAKGKKEDLSLLHQ